MIIAGDAENRPKSKKPDYKKLKAAAGRELLLTRLKKALRRNLHVNDVRELLGLSTYALADLILGRRF